MNAYLDGINNLITILFIQIVSQRLTFVRRMHIFLPIQRKIANVIQ
jgi:hypothetical protein